ncbi:MAG: YggS family pyridoxal phosphate-dependent enzyme [Bacteroidota bacterium]
MTIAENLIRIKNSLPAGVKLAAVSKTHPVEDIMEAYATGHRCFAENKAQELSAKQPLLPSDIEWHFIGHMQTNKVKYIAGFVTLIHSVDSLKLLQVIDKEAFKNNRVIACLLQFHIAEEETKFGLSPDEALEMLHSTAFAGLKNIRIAGVMGMATFTEDTGQVRREFRQLKSIFDRLKREYFAEDPGFCEISMGMSDDYRVAVEEGSTLVRVGSSIFGARSYS